MELEKPVARTTICTLAGIVAVALLLLLTPSHPFAAKGIVLPAATIPAPIAADLVTIYDNVPDFHFRRMGQVRAELAFDQETPETRAQLIATVKSLAASVGANGVVVHLFVANNSLSNTLSFVGTAIAVSKGKKS